MNFSPTNINLPSPSNMNFPLQYKPPTSNINHPPRQKRKSTQSPDCNMGVAQDIIQSLTSRTGRHNSQKHLQKCIVNIFLICFGQETLKPAL